MDGAQWALLEWTREHRRLSKTELAAAMGTSRMHLGQLEKGIENPGYLMVESWAESLGVSMDLVKYMRRAPLVDAQTGEAMARYIAAGVASSAVIDALHLASELVQYFMIPSDADRRAVVTWIARQALNGHERAAIIDKLRERWRMTAAAP